MSLDVDGQYRILNQILSLCCISANPPKLALVIGTQATAQPIEQRAVRSRVAVQTGKHQGLKFDFMGRHACVSLSSQERPVRLQPTVPKTHGTREAGGITSGGALPSF